MLKKLLIAVLALVAILVVVGFLLPDDVHLERSVSIDAPACTVYAQLVDFHRFNEWSPWAAIDPNTQYTFGGTPGGVGHTMSWVSEDKNVGSGSQKITAAEPYSHVASHLDFGAQGVADAFFKLEPEGDAVKVVWGFDSSFDGNLIGRYFGLMMDGMLGPQYEEGLSNLKRVSEALPKTDWCEADIAVTDVPARTVATAAGKSGPGAEEIAAAMGEAFGKVIGFLTENKLEMAGRPLSIDKAWDETEGYAFEAGLPLASNPNLEAEEGADVVIHSLDATKAVRLVHTGPYTGLTGAYEAMEAYMAANGLEPSGSSWSEYMNDPAEVAEAELVTHVYFPIDG